VNTGIAYKKAGVGQIGAATQILAIAKISLASSATNTARLKWIPNTPASPATPSTARNVCSATRPAKKATFFDQRLKSSRIFVETGLVF